MAGRGEGRRSRGASAVGSHGTTVGRSGVAVGSVESTFDSGGD